MSTNTLLDIVWFLIDSIKNHTEDPSEDFLASLTPYKKDPQLKELLRFDHKYHDPCRIPLRHCRKSHCVQCLNSEIDEGTCYHYLPLTHFEKVLVVYLTKNIPYYSSKEFKYFKCNICKIQQEVNKQVSKQCKCPLCDKCIIDEYKNRNLKCTLCKKKFENDYIAEVFLSFDVQKFSLLDSCKKCDLVYEADALNNDQLCFFCLQQQNNNN